MDHLRGRHFVGILLFGLLSQTAGLFPFPALAADQAQPLTLDSDPHLVGWWAFDTTSGKRVVDSSKQAHHGVLDGSLTFDGHSVPGRIGAALKLDGQDEGVTITGYKGVTGSHPRTLAVWIKTTATSGQLVSWGHDDFGRMWIFGFIRARIGVTPKGGYLYMKAGIHDDAWHHVAVVVREASPPNLHDDVKLYRDGVLAEIDDIGLLDLWPIETGDQKDVRIGWRFKGLIDDLRLYDRPLSEDEVNSLYKLESHRPLSPSSN